MNQFIAFFTAAFLFSFSSLQSIDQFFQDDIDAGLVSFDPLTIDQSQGIFGNSGEANEDSIGGIFTGEDLTGIEQISDFSVGGDLFVGGGDDQFGDDDDAAADEEVINFPGNVFEDDVVPVIPEYGSDDDQTQASQLQQGFQNDILNLLN